ncbi:hypothetical protein DUNSADRAFT_13626 [Dunaliella salina]|uniref:2,4-dienoyl-CoA reductase [(3E)-enoyl-CoA-producing] n=1 Tax=Dunaliella salina TaxID=3046 RepID=A0ABQ7G939_DUNSA|nr:hypothetical protein DUNSADRAFT_13626 [Dunaliella salina]|eukprot:KAF5831095.1 hypothetical protein DUNSADRAFT_13626 [Dunaliella salina]
MMQLGPRSLNKAWGKCHFRQSKRWAGAEFADSAHLLSPAGITKLGPSFFTITRQCMPSLAIQKMGGKVLSELTRHALPLPAGIMQLGPSSVTKAEVPTTYLERLAHVRLYPTGFPSVGMMKLGPSSAGKVQEEITSRVPLGRMGSKWDIAMACTFLASPAAGYISGDTLVVDGASWMWDPPLVPRHVVAKVSRSVESQSRAEGLAKTAASTRSKL